MLNTLEKTRFKRPVASSAPVFANGARTAALAYALNELSSRKRTDTDFISEMQKHRNEITAAAMKELRKLSGMDVLDYAKEWWHEYLEYFDTWEDFSNFESTLNSNLDFYRAVQGDMRLKGLSLQYLISDNFGRNLSEGIVNGIAISGKTLVTLPSKTLSGVDATISLASKLFNAIDSDPSYGISCTAKKCVPSVY